MSEKASKGTLFGPDKLQNHIHEGKGKEKKKELEVRKEGEEKKNNGYTLSSYNGYFGELFFGQTKLLDPKCPFGGNVFKNPASYIL